MTTQTAHEIIAKIYAAYPEMTDLRLATNPDQSTVAEFQPCKGRFVPVISRMIGDATNWYRMPEYEILVNGAPIPVDWQEVSR